MKDRIGIARKHDQSELLRLRNGSLRPYITDDPFDVSGSAHAPAEQAHATIYSFHCLQDIADYRAALRSWFAGVRTGGHLIIVVSNAFLRERRLSLPVQDRPNLRRLYTPRSLLDEVEEALVPNSYRIRLLSDDDEGYDYNLADGAPQTGHSDIVLVIEKIESPVWPLTGPAPAASDGPNYAFEPPRTRVELARTKAHQKILILKLDHLGDFIISVSALQRFRTLFRKAHITLVVGSWNLDLAEGLGVADEVLTFDAFPRNSSEEEVDVPGKRALLEKVLPERYDLAIDLRTDTDTRTLLGRVNADIKAGLGTKADFPFLDIALPIDLDRTSREAARETLFNHHAFYSQGSVLRLPHRAVFSAAGLERGSAVIWGPYSRLRAGRYMFDAFVEIDLPCEGLLMLDIGLDTRRVARRVVAPGDPMRLEFDVERPDSLFEFRIWGVEEIPAPGFSFYGGRLVRQGIPGELHQSDYLELLVELIARRLDRVGLLAEVGVP